MCTAQNLWQKLCWLLKLCLIWSQNFGTYTAQKLAQLGRKKIAQACLQCLSLFASLDNIDAKDNIDGKANIDAKDNIDNSNLQFFSLWY